LLKKDEDIEHCRLNSTQRTGLFSINLKKITLHVCMDGNAAVTGGRTWKFPCELHLLSFQEHNCWAAHCQREARQSPMAGAAWWGERTALG